MQPGECPVHWEAADLDHFDRRRRREKVGDAAVDVVTPAVLGDEAAVGVQRDVARRQQGAHQVVPGRTGNG